MTRAGSARATAPDRTAPPLLLVEPYWTGSHKAWATGYRDHSGLDVRVLALPGRFWKWRMHGGAVTLARRLPADAPRPCAVLATDMLDVAAFLGLARDRLRDVPVALYMHENQLGYPEPQPESHWTDSRRRRAARRDVHYAFTNLTSALAADVVIWNSEHNRRSFLEALPPFLRAFPDYRELGAAPRIAAKSVVLPVGLDLAALDAARPPARRSGPPRIVWNHRWEHDKGPDAFFAALYALADASEAFEVILLGESFASTPAVFAQARARLGDRLAHFGYVRDRAGYARWLWEADIVVSTARHEFFGVSVCEAAYCGCIPILPDGLAYPELVPEDLHAAFLYRGREELQAKLRAALHAAPAGAASRLRERIGELDWRRVAPRYDTLLGDLAASGPAAVRAAAGAAP